jgi:hypothetical protein
LQAVNIIILLRRAVTLGQALFALVSRKTLFEFPAFTSDWRDILSTEIEYHIFI